MEQPQSDIPVDLIEQLDEDKLEEFIALTRQELNSRPPEKERLLKVRHIRRGREY